MTGTIAALAGLLLVAGVLLVVVGVRRGPVTADAPVRRRRATGGRWAQLTHRPAGAAGRRRDLSWLLAVGLGLAVGLLTGWLIAVVVIPLLVVALPVILRAPRQREAALLEALDRWIRTLAATLPTGRSIPDAIRLSRRTAPPLLSEPIDLLVARLNARWTPRDALLRFADDLDSPDADGVVAALILACNRGSQGATTTLAELADSVQAQLRARREVEVERAKPYVVVRQVTGITVVTAVVVALIGRTFFAPYGTPIGQLILLVLVVAYVASLLLMRYRARAVIRDRVLIGGGS